MNKQLAAVLIILGIVAAIGVAAFFFRSQPVTQPTMSPEQTTDTQENLPTETNEPVTEVDAVENGAYTVNTEESTVNWEGRKTLIANYKDMGTIQVQSGRFTIANDTVTNGTITFNMASIHAESTSGPGAITRLESHLKSEDFFDVENHPTARFTFTGAERSTEGALTVHGDLTIKDITKPIRIPVQLGSVNGRVVAAGSVEVDRAAYNVRYGSNQFFDNLADNVIDDFFTLRFTLVADAE